MKQQDYLEIIELNKGKHHPPLETLILGRKLSSDNKKDSHDYSEDYLTFIALEDGTISFNIWVSMGTDMITSISYSTDDGETWTTINNTNNKEEHLSIDVDVNEGDKVMWKGIATQTGYNDEDDYGDYVGSFFSSDCEFDVKGNVMSLLYGDDFKDKTTLDEDGIFCQLFSDFNEEKTCGVINAKDLSLPATTLTKYCYSCMFSGCTSLVTAPELPVTTLTEGCYSFMFRNCTNLTITPQLPATTLTINCYYYMFQGCTSLITAPQLPATTLANNCYDSMFDGCTSLTTTPKLSATTLASYCYNYMFNGCTSLTTAPELPATTLASSCYDSMFSGCTSLTAAPQLPATTMTYNCYREMFKNCTSLTTAPDLPATTLYPPNRIGDYDGTTAGCYYQMFYGCSSLNYIKAMFIACTWTQRSNPSSSTTAYCTKDWVTGVAANGTFVKNSLATWNITGVNGVPTGWTVETASE